MPHRKKFKDLEFKSQDMIQRRIKMTEECWNVKLPQAIDQDIRPPGSDPREWGRSIHDELPFLARSTRGNVAQANTLLRSEIIRRRQSIESRFNKHTPYIIGSDIKRATAATIDPANAAPNATEDVDVAESDDDCGEYIPRSSTRVLAIPASPDITRSNFTAVSTTEAEPTRSSGTVTKAQSAIVSKAKRPESSRQQISQQPFQHVSERRAPPVPAAHTDNETHDAEDYKIIRLEHELAQRKVIENESKTKEVEMRLAIARARTRMNGRKRARVSVATDVVDLGSESDDGLEDEVDRRTLANRKGENAEDAVGARTSKQIAALVMASKLTAVVSRHSIFQPATITKFVDMDPKSQRYFEEDVTSIEQHWGCRLIDVVSEEFRPDQEPRNWGFRMIELLERLAKETTGDLLRAQTLIHTEYAERWRRRVRTAARDTPHIIETDLERAIEAAQRANRSRARKPRLAASARVQKTVKRPRTAVATPPKKADTKETPVDFREHISAAAAQLDCSGIPHQPQRQSIPQRRAPTTDIAQLEPRAGTLSLVPRQQRTQRLQRPMFQIDQALRTERPSAQLRKPLEKYNSLPPLLPTAWRWISNTAKPFIGPVDQLPHYAST
ncbi:hypothetical protein H2199_005973 [Coniosporium tulheliwenetii]|uniref:Uncharacterized protein n=1 Tax=Coniosporium tulheliwenetii TaxID=3383036 RepID=A0ACC2YYN9_9PEZI|nr:hypothetical protein H2199_005973 [Cladosporium sp. JES 115]